jgi:ribokinase
MKILCVGNMNMDIIFPTERLPGPHQKMSIPGALIGYGGSAANTAYWLARLGCRVSMAGAVGDDPPGEGQIGHLKSVGVDTGGVSREKTASGVAVILARGEEKRMIRSPGANQGGYCRPEILEGCRLVYLSGSNSTLLRRYAEEAASRGVAVFYGPAGRSEVELLEAADGIILNDDELRKITGLTDPGEGLLFLKKSCAAVTLSRGGCLVAAAGKMVEVPSPRLEPVDRTGGGDAFAAGFLRDYMAGGSPEDWGETGNAMATAVITRWGARPEDVGPLPA